MPPEPAPQGDAPEGVELPPDLWPAWVLFNDVWTQWRCVVGWERVCWLGVDLPALQAAMDLRGIPPKRRPELLWLVQEMQTEALKFRNHN